MRGKNVLGIVFANSDDDVIRELTGVRSVASVPFGGGYRIIDFVLSNMVNAGVSKVGVITNNNYQSLMDHVGSGKPWDLTGRNGGLYLLPPFNAAAIENYSSSRIGALKNIDNFLARSTEEYVLMTDCTYVANIDFNEVFERHEAAGADVTILYRRGAAPKLSSQLVFDEIKDGFIRSLSISSGADSGEVDYALKCILLKKSLLERLVNDSYARSDSLFEKDILQKNVDRIKMYAYEVKGFCPVIDSVKSYFDANFALLDKDVYRELFFSRPVFTKVYEDMPAIYGISSRVTNSLISDGTVINGTVENSIIFRDSRVEKGAVVKNSIIMPHGIISAGAALNYVVTDKDVTISAGRQLSGAESFPVYIGKGIRV